MATSPNDLGEKIHPAPCTLQTPHHQANEIEIVPKLAGNWFHMWAMLYRIEIKVTGLRHLWTFLVE